MLIGAADVKQAGNMISSAAESMRQTVGHLDDMLLLYLRRSEELVMRIETAMEKPNLEFMKFDDEQFEGMLVRMKRMRETEHGK